MADLLSSEDIRTALGALPGWDGDTSGLVRTVDVPPVDHDALRAALMALGDELDHHPVVEPSGSGLHLLLSTHSAGGVTAKDVDLAARIDRLLSGSGAPYGTGG